jgi:hypothetical protein
MLEYYSFLIPNVDECVKHITHSSKGLLERTSKQARNETLKVHEMEQLY